MARTITRRPQTPPTRSGSARTRLWSVAIAALLAVAPASHLLAQRPTLEPGRLIRVTHACRMNAGERVIKEVCDQDTGRFVTVSPDSLTFDGETRTTLARSTIRRVDVQGRGGSAGKGATIGGAIAGLFGGVASAAAGAAFDPDNDVGAGFVAGAVGLGLGGALIGALVGAAIPRDVWREVPITDQTVAVTPVLTPRGVGVGLRF